MIIPSIDLKGGQVVQLIGGAEPALEAGDPRPLAERFGVAGELAVIDLDAALGTGSNRDLITPLLGDFDCRVGGGIRSYAAAADWLDAGAARIILGSAARPDLLRRLPRERVLAAVDAVDGEVVIHGWQTRTGANLLDRVRELSPYVGGFLVTFVEREGRLQGTSLEQARAVVAAAGDARVTIAGGITTAEEVAALDRMGADAQVGMALYTDVLDLGDALAAPLVSDRPDGLWATLVCDEGGRALGLAWSDAESLRAAIAQRRGIYHSRKRGLWEKGASSGATQELLRVEVDCDRDALRFIVRQAGPGFCHTGTTSCFGPARGLPALEAQVAARVAAAPPGSYTRRLLDDPALLQAKLREEARELAEATDRAHVAQELADVLYFALVAAGRSGVTLAEAEAVLDRRARRITRRPGDAKEDAC